MESATSSVTLENAETSEKKYAFELSVIILLFFIFGFLTCLNDILVPHLKSLFTLNYAQATLVQFCFFSAYFFMSIPSGRIVRKFGYQKGMVLGLFVTAIGALGFFPAAEFRSYAFFLTSLFVLASGITLLQVAANPYATFLGKPETAPGRLTLVQAFNSLGTTIAPLLGAHLILARSEGASELVQAQSVQTPYLFIAFTLIALSVIIAKVKLPKIASENVGTEKFDFRKYPLLAMGVFGIFAYVGGEVAIGSLLINWMGDAQLGSIDAATAGKYVAFYWGAAMVGRFIGTSFLIKFKPAKVLYVFALSVIALILVSMFTSGTTALASILLIGFFNSIMFPTIFSLSVAGLGAFTANASGILCTAIVGGALIPLFQGLAADHIGLRFSFFIPMVCYFYIVYFAHRSQSLTNKVRS